MAELLVSTVRRNCPPSEASGFFYSVDVESKRVVSRSNLIEPAYRAVDPNNRGGIRGAKGISFHDDEVAIANSNVVFRYDKDWSFLGWISNPCCAGIHDLFHDGETLWVTSARNDLVLQFDREGHLLSHLNVRDAFANLHEVDCNLPCQPVIDDKLHGTIDFRDPRTHDLETFNRAHINSVCKLPSRELLVSAGIIWTGEFVRLFRAKRLLRKAGVWWMIALTNAALRKLLNRPKPMHTELVRQPAYSKSLVLGLDHKGDWRLCLVLSNVSVPSHSLRPLSDGSVLYLNTSQGSIVRFVPSTGRVLSDVKVTDGFLRGATELRNGVIAVGTIGEVILYDPHREQVQHRIRFSDESSESVFDVKEIPPHFAPLPSILPAPSVPADGCELIRQPGRATQDSR